MKRHFLCLLFLCGALGAYAVESTSPTVAEATQQGVPVKGVVKDAKGEPIIGATVTEKGTKNSTVTDYDGNYSLGVSNRNATLVVSYIGFITQEVRFLYSPAWHHHFGGQPHSVDSGGWH